jgi:hypothetical protein
VVRALHEGETPCDQEIARRVKRYQGDHAAFCREVLKIRNKKGRMVPFELNNVQRYLWEECIQPALGKGRLMLYLLKARQMGASTLTESLAYNRTSLLCDQHALVVAHLAKAAAKVFHMAKLMRKTADPDFRPMIKQSNRQELYFANPHDDGDLGIESYLQIETADNEDLGAGHTVQLVHMSEFARYDKKQRNIPELLATLLQAVPDEPGSVVLFETTAEGMNYACDYWYADNGVMKVFTPWTAHAEYTSRTPLKRSELHGNHITFDDERAVIEAVALSLREWWPHFDTDEKVEHEALCRMAWRRKKIQIDCSNDLTQFHKQYPLTPDEAFRTSSPAVFDVNRLWDQKEAAVAHALEVPPGPHIWVPASDEDRVGHLGEFVVREGGSYLEFENPQPGNLYSLGADPGGGFEEADPSVIQVIKCGRPAVQVGCVAGTIPPFDLALMVAWLAHKYRGAYVVPEATGLGIALVSKLVELNVPNLHIREGDVAVIGPNSTQAKAGFYTSVTTKPILISQLQDAILQEDIVLRDLETIQELGIYQQLGIYGTTPKYGAPKGKHDDHVMGLALAYHGNLLMRDKAVGTENTKPAWWKTAPRKLVDLVA